MIIITRVLLNRTEHFNNTFISRLVTYQYYEVFNSEKVFELSFNKQPINQ